MTKTVFVGFALTMGLALTLTSAPALAGSLSDPVVAPEVVAAAAVESSSDELQSMLALIALAVILTAAIGS